MKVEDVFSSKPRMKILKILVRFGELNSSEIARKLGINYATTAKHLNVLETESILTHKTFGRIRLYRLNENSPRAKATQALVETWEQADKQ